jgi:AraC family transcriptional regulator
MAVPRALLVEQEAARRPFSVIFNHPAEWNGAQVYHARVGPGELGEHFHAAHQVVIPLAGSFVTEAHSANGRSRIAQRTVGHTCVIPSGQPYTARWDEELEYVLVYFDSGFIARAASDLFIPGRVEMVEACGASDPLIRQIGLSLTTEIASGMPAGRVYGESLVNLLAAHLLRHYSAAGGKVLPFSGGLAKHKLRRATEYISEHLDGELALADIAGAVELSPYHFARAFKQATGLTPHQFLIKARIERAKSLLAETELPIVEVSHRAGFKNQSHFTTIFRKLTAMTPKAYRDEQLR